MNNEIIETVTTIKGFGSIASLIVLGTTLIVCIFKYLIPMVQNVHQATATADRESKKHFYDLAKIALDDNRKEIISLRSDLIKLKDEVVMKSNSKLLLILFLFLSSCSGDEIVVHKKIKQIGQQHYAETTIKEIEKPSLGKTCSPPCDPPTKCNSSSGRCEGNADTEKVKYHSPQSYDFNFNYIRFGRELD